jgi:hypothetical protein
MRLKKIITSFVMMVCALVIPLSSVFAASGYQFVGTHYTNTWSETWGGWRTVIPAEYMGGDYMKICVGPGYPLYFDVYDYDPDNPDDLIGSKMIGGSSGGCGEFYIGGQTDGDNSEAEIYVVTSNRYTEIDFYD